MKETIDYLRSFSEPALQDMLHEYTAQCLTSAFIWAVIWGVVLLLIYRWQKRSIDVPTLAVVVVCIIPFMALIKNIQVLLNPEAYAIEKLIDDVQ